MKQYSSEELDMVIESFATGEARNITVYADSSYLYNDSATSLYYKLKRRVKKLSGRIRVVKEYNTIMLYK